MSSGLAINKVYKKYNLERKGYKKIRMDFELVIYKDYGDFDIEVSGLENYRMKRVYGKVYVWQKKDILRTVKRIEYTSFEQLYNILMTIDSLSLDEIIEYEF